MMDHLFFFMGSFSDEAISVYVEPVANTIPG
jgi:hypothetical protein